MKQLGDEDVSRIVGEISTRTLTVEQANLIHGAVKRAFANYSNERKKGIDKGTLVKIEHHGQTFRGIVRKVGPKNLKIELEEGQMVTAHPSLVSVDSE